MRRHRPLCSEMMSDRNKALFFDIDGTLLSEKTGLVPDSAKQAIKEARKRGHLVFINTGRVYPHTRDIRSEIETDGCLCGCGTYVIAEAGYFTATRSPMRGACRLKKISTSAAGRCAGRCGRMLSAQDGFQVSPGGRTEGGIEAVGHRVQV